MKKELKPKSSQKNFLSFVSEDAKLFCREKYISRHSILREKFLPRSEKNQRYVSNLFTECWQ